MRQSTDEAVGLGLKASNAPQKSWYLRRPTTKIYGMRYDIYPDRKVPASKTHGR